MGPQERAIAQSPSLGTPYPTVSPNDPRILEEGEEWDQRVPPVAGFVGHSPQVTL